MNKGGIGVGSASIVLIFAVLCLTIFSLLSVIIAQNSKALIDAEVRLVTGYYRTDVQAQLILAEFLDANPKPDSIGDISINIEKQYDDGLILFSFSYPIYDSTSKELFVRVAATQGSYYIMSWRIINNADWEADNRFNVFLD